MNFKKQLQQAINNEDYERADELKKLIESGEESYISLTANIKASSVTIESLNETTRGINELAKGDKNLYKEYFEVPKPSAKLMNEYSKLGFSLEETTSLLMKLSNNPYKLKHRIKNILRRISGKPDLASIIDYVKNGGIKNPFIKASLQGCYNPKHRIKRIIQLIDWKEYTIYATMVLLGLVIGIIIS